MTGAPYNGGGNIYQIPASDANNTFVGDPVILEGNASAGGADVYNIFIPGQESYDMVDLDGYSAQFIYAPPEIASPRLRLYQTAGWKMAQVFNITNTSWIVNLRCTLAVAL